MNVNLENRMYVNDSELLRLGEVKEYTVWYNGNSSELLEFYTEAITKYFASNPIYSRNRMQYFWARAVNSGKAFRRTHDNLFADIIDILTNIVGNPIITGDDLDAENAKTLVDALDLWHIVNQLQLPLTLAQGTGCFKVSSNPFKAIPSVDYYPADRIKYHAEGNEIIGIDFIDTLKDDKTDLVYKLYENRYLTHNLSDGSSDLHIEFHLYRWHDYQDRHNDEVSLSTLPETRNLQDSVIKGIGKLFAIPTTILMDKRGGLYGRSIGEGKLDLLDMVDEAWSIEGRAIRLSTPQTYMPESLLRTGEKEVWVNGNREIQIVRTEPDTFDRDFIITGDDVIPNGDGRGGINNNIRIDQPQIDVDAYHKARQRAIIEILNGVMSSATLGVNAVPNMNEPLESREREKITTLTRNLIVSKETAILNALLTDVLDMADYKRDGIFYLRADKATPRVKVRFSEFANPSLESELKVLGNAWSAGQISTELYVENLWRDRLTDEEKEAEKKRLEDTRREALLAPALYEGQNVDNLEDVLKNGIANSDIASDAKQEEVFKEGKADDSEDVSLDIRK